MRSAFRNAIEWGDPEAVAETLAPGVVFRSPAVYKPYEGREATMALLRLVAEVFEDFEYTDELRGDGTHALVFRARVGDKQVEGLDHLTIDDEGLVSELMVMVRPLSGLIALAEAMGRKLEAAGLAQPPASAV
jgi:hypothetical protein